MEKYLGYTKNKLEIMLQFKKLINQNLKMKTNIFNHKIWKILKSENFLLFIEAFNTKDNYYIVMELCLINLEECMKIRNDELSNSEILIQLNKILMRKILFIQI